MALDPSFAGKQFPPSPVYEVGREKIAEFAAAVGSDHPAHRDPEAARALGYKDVVAPPTFAVIVAQRCEAQYVADPASGIDFTRVVHGEEKFRHTRPIVAGDRLVATLHVDAVRAMGGHGMVSTRVEIADQTGAAVSTVTSTLVVRGPDEAR
jgi:acyl dehydratase